MLWSLFAREFSQKARAIARTVSNAPASLGGGTSAPSDPRRPSMRLAIEDVSAATTDTSKKEKMGALLLQMKVIYAIDVCLYLFVFAAVIKALVRGETMFGSDHDAVARLLLFILGLGMGITLETLALYGELHQPQSHKVAPSYSRLSLSPPPSRRYIHYKELSRMELTDSQKAVSEAVFDVRSTTTHNPFITKPTLTLASNLFFALASHTGHSLRHHDDVPAG